VALEINNRDIKEGIGNEGRRKKRKLLIAKVISEARKVAQLGLVRRR
jgi:hypothetical protein